MTTELCAEKRGRNWEFDELVANVAPHPNATSCPIEGKYFQNPIFPICVSSPSRALMLIPEVTYVTALHRDFPGGLVVKNLPANSGDTGSIPDPGRSHMAQSGSN